MQCIVWAVKYTVWAIYFAVYIRECTVCTQCTLEDKQYAVYRIGCTVYSVNYAINSVKCTVGDLQCVCMF